MLLAVTCWVNFATTDPALATVSCRLYAAGALRMCRLSPLEEYYLILCSLRLGLFAAHYKNTNTFFPVVTATLHASQRLSSFTVRSLGFLLNSDATGTANLLDVGTVWFMTSIMVYAQGAATVLCTFVLWLIRATSAFLCWSMYWILHRKIQAISACLYKLPTSMCSVSGTVHILSTAWLPVCAMRVMCVYSASRPLYEWALFTRIMRRCRCTFPHIASDWSMTSQNGLHHMILALPADKQVLDSSLYNRYNMHWDSTVSNSRTHN